jgi:hypothetical protein
MSFLVKAVRFIFFKKSIKIILYLNIIPQRTTIRVGIPSSSWSCHEGLPVPWHFEQQHWGRRQQNRQRWCHTHKTSQKLGEYYKAMHNPQMRICGTNICIFFNTSGKGQIISPGLTGVMPRSLKFEKVKWSRLQLLTVSMHWLWLRRHVEMWISLKFRVIVKTGQRYTTFPVKTRRVKIPNHKKKLQCREQTTPTEQPPPVGEVIANSCG